MGRRVTRREFIKLGTLGAASAVLAGCELPRRWVALEPFVRPPEEQLAGQATWYASTCRQCPAGCGIIVRIMNGRALKIEGNPEHPLNRGKLCARGQAGLQLLYNPDRLQAPARQARRGSREFQTVAWNEAINTLFDRLQAANGRVAVWTGSTVSGHLLGLFRRLVSAVAGLPVVQFDLYTAFHGYQALAQADEQLYGVASLPTYELSQADVVFSFGADLFATWLSSVRYGLEYGAFRSQASGKRGYLVQFEPRLSTTGAKADRWLPSRPGTEAMIAQAMTRLIADHSFGTPDRVAKARALAEEVDVNAISSASGIPLDDLSRLARVFAEAAYPLAIPGSHLAGSGDGVAASAAVQALNILARPQAVPGSTVLSAESAEPSLTGRTLSTYAEAQALIQQMRDGKIEVLLVHSANPAYELPPKAGFVEALKNVPFVVSFNPLVDETGIWSDLIMPDRTYLESWGYQVVAPSFGVPVVSGQQPVVTPVYDLRSTADVLLTVAKGIPSAAKALPWPDEVAYLKEAVARLPPGASGGSGDEVLWARFLQHGGWWPAAAPAQAAIMSAVTTPLKVPLIQFLGEEKEYPYYLHLFMGTLLSDGSGASQPWLQGSPETMTSISWQTWVEINPKTAQSIGVQDGDIVNVTSPVGQVEAVVYTYPAIRPDTVALPLGQGHTDLGRYARDRGGNPLNVVSADVDATGNYLAWSDVRVKITPTGRKIALATFESKAGVTTGFINQGFPGE